MQSDNLLHSYKDEPRSTRTFSDYAACEEQFDLPFHVMVCSQFRESSPKAQSILDLGCGTGQLLKMLSMDSHEVWGVEKNLKKIQIAKSNFASSNVTATIINADVEKLVESRTILPEGYFDSVMAIFSLHYFNSQRLAKAVSRWLQPDGMFVVIGLSQNYDPPNAFMNPCISKELLLSSGLAVTQSRSWQKVTARFYSLRSKYEARSNQSVKLKSIKAIQNIWMHHFEVVHFQLLFNGLYYARFRKKKEK